MAEGRAGVRWVRAVRWLGLALFAWILWRTDLGEVGRELRAARWPWIAAAVLGIVPLLAAKGSRWHRLLGRGGIRLPWPRAILIYALGLFGGAVTPGQSGDLIKAWYVQATGAPLAPALGATLLDRLGDLLALLSLAFLGIGILGGIPAWPLALVALGALVALALLGRPDWRRRLVDPWLPAPLRRRMDPLDALHLGPRGWLELLLWTAGATGVTLGRLYLVARGVGIALPPLAFVGGMGLMASASLLAVAGVGTRDLVLTLLLARYGYSSAQAVAFSALILLLYLQNLLLGLPLLWWTPGREREDPHPSTPRG